VIAFAFALARADGGAELQVSATQQIAAGRQAGQQWLDDGTTSQGAGPGASWCNEMARWMTDNMANGQMTMTHNVCQAPEAMRDVGVQAMAPARALTLRSGATRWSAGCPNTWATGTTGTGIGTTEGHAGASLEAGSILLGVGAVVGGWVSPQRWRASTSARVEDV
jgi:hypothetical protein